MMKTHSRTFVQVTSNSAQPNIPLVFWFSRYRRPLFERVTELANNLLKFAETPNQ
jgi:hypothetical protein